MQAGQGIKLAQHGRTAERVQPASIDMPGLALGIQQLATRCMDTLYATFSATTYIGLFHPFATLAPEILEAIVGRVLRFRYLFNCHAVTSFAKYIRATWRRAE
ncbi:hypothetical protein D3C76_1495450 [compost metagenome]